MLLVALEEDLSIIETVTSSRPGADSFMLFKALMISAGRGASPRPRHFQHGILHLVCRAVAGGIDHMFFVLPDLSRHLVHPIHMARPW